MERIEELEVAQELTDYERERGKPLPSWNHGMVQAELSRALLNKYDTQYSVVSETTIQFPNQRMTPDLSVYPLRPKNWRRDPVVMTEMPLLTIEILSPKQGLADIEEKITEMHKAGVVCAWVVLPSLRTIVIYESGKDAHVITAGEVRDNATGISVTIEEIFK
jgi:Uma2 family endonuclease